MSFPTSRTIHSRFTKATSVSEVAFVRSLPLTLSHGPFLTHLTSLITHMKFDNEVEYLPLDQRGQELPRKRGFLKRLLDCLSITRVYSDRTSSHSSSGGEVEEDVIEF